MLNTYSFLALMFFTCQLQAQQTTNGGTIKIEAGGSLSCKSNFTNTGLLLGSLRVEGNLSNSGTLTSETSAGTTIVKGDYTAKPETVQDVKIGGAISSSYGQLNVSGNVYLNGTLSASFIHGFTPSAGDPDLPIITGTINGRFAAVNIPSQYLLVYNGNSVVLRSLKGSTVTFINVVIQKEGSGAVASWSVQNEASLSRYEIEKSTDSINFVKLGEVKAATQTRYSFMDTSPEAKTYYRIKGVGNDGKNHYSLILTYNQKISSASLNVFPSPAAGTLNIQHTAAASSSCILIVSMDGKVMKTVYPAQGAQVSTVNVSDLSSGIYLVSFDNGQGQKTETIKFVKQKT